MVGADHGHEGEGGAAAYSDSVVSDYVVVMTTLDDEGAAGRLCRSLVEEGLVACTQRLPVESVYRWQGALVEDRELLVLCKTRRDRAAELAEALRARHPYDVPEILELPVTAGWPPYLRWIDEQTVPRP